MNCEDIVSSFYVAKQEFEPVDFSMIPVVLRDNSISAITQEKE